MQIEPTMTMPRDEMIQAVKKRRETVVAEKAQERLDVAEKLAAAAAYPAALVEWHAEIAEGLTNGQYTVRASGDVVPAKGGSEPSDKPEFVDGRYSNLEYIDNAETADLDWLDTVLILLEAADDVDVTMNAREYERLLNGRIGSRY